MVLGSSGCSAEDGAWSPPFEVGKIRVYFFARCFVCSFSLQTGLGGWRKVELHHSPARQWNLEILVSSWQFCQQLYKCKLPGIEKACQWWLAKKAKWWSHCKCVAECQPCHQSLHFKVLTAQIQSVVAIHHILLMLWFSLWNSGKYLGVDMDHKTKWIWICELQLNGFTFSCSFSPPCQLCHSTSWPPLKSH